MSWGRGLVLGLALVGLGAAAQAQCLFTAPPSHGGRSQERDATGLPWYAQPVCYRADFGDAGLTLPGEERDSLAQRVQGARRLYATDCVAAETGPERPDRAPARLAYLRWWLGLQGVVLEERSRSGPMLSFIDGGHQVVLQIVPCPRRLPPVPRQP